MDGKLKIKNFSFFDQLFKNISDLAFLMSALRLFHLFMQKGKNVFLKDLLLDQNDLSLNDAANHKK